MTNKKKLLLAMACSAAIGVTSFAGVTEAASNPFAAVPTSSKSYDDVAALVDHGLIYGYKKGDFDKTRTISRMEMAIFTGKAMSAMDRAGAEDTQRINRLIKEYQSELTDLHVQIPGVKAKKDDKGGKAAAAKDSRIKQIPQNYNFNGMIRLRHDWGSGNYQGSKNKEQEFGGNNNNQILLQFNNKFAINKDWSGEIVFFAAKNSDGDSRNSGENTTGVYDFGRAYVQGPLLNGTVRMGRLKGSNVYGYSMIMGQYYNGITYTKKLGKKWTADLGWGKVDYATNGTAADGAPVNENFRYRRGVSGSDMNPDNLGVNMTQAQVKYQASKDFSVVGSWWHLTARGGGDSDAYNTDTKVASGDTTAIAAKKNTRKRSTYGDPDIMEIGFQWDASRKLTVRGMYAQSSWEGVRGTGKSAYGLSLQWGKVNANNPHSSRLQLDLLHAGRYTGIKSTYDLKNKAGEGQRGFIIDYRYVPVKNIMLDFRWMHYRTIGTSDKGAYGMKNANQYRVQLYYYF